jgi:hypothetical protein
MATSSSAGSEGDLASTPVFKDASPIAQEQIFKARILALRSMLSQDGTAEKFYQQSYYKLCDVVDAWESIDMGWGITNQNMLPKKVLTPEQTALIEANKEKALAKKRRLAHDLQIAETMQWL